MKMGHVTIQSAAYEESIAFYQEVVKLTIQRSIDLPKRRITFLSNATGETMVEIIHAPEKAFQGTGISIGFYVDDVLAYKEELESKGYTATAISSPNPETSFFFVKDPNGLQIQFIRNGSNKGR